MSSNPDELEIILHRMTHLLIHRLNLDAAFVNLLLGSFADWMNASDTERGITPEIYADSDDVMAILTILDPVRRAAALRVATMYRVAQSTAHKTPPESTVAYYWGVLIDTHMKLLLHPHKLMIHEVYAKNLAPEQTRLADVYTDNQYPLSPAAIEKIWRPYINSAPFPVPSKRKAPSPSEPVITRRARRKRKKPTAPIVLLQDPPSIDIVSDFTVPQDPTAFRKILAKAMPRSTTVRSIGTLLRKAILFKPEENKAVVQLVRKFLVGGHRHATSIGSAAFRVRVYNTDTEWMYKLIAQLSNKDLYAMVAEYAIGMARMLPALHHLLQQDPDWEKYSSQSIVLCDKFLRPRLFGHPNIDVPPKIVASFERPVKMSEIMWALIKALKVGRKVQKSEIDAARIVAPSLHKMYAVFRRQCGEQRIYATVLAEVGMRETDINTLRDGFSNLEANKMNTQLKAMLTKMSAGGRAILHLYVHMLYQQSTFAVIPVRLERPEPPPMPNAMPFVLVCTTCCIVLSQAHGINKCRKSKDGIHVDTINFGVTCSACGTLGVEKVDLRTNRVVGLSVNDMTEPRMFTACRMCGCVTAYNHVVGCDELCGECFATAKARLVARRCICGVEFTSRNKVARTFTALDNDGKMALFALCEKHKHILKHVVTEFHEIEFYRGIIRGQI